MATHLFEEVKSQNEQLVGQLVDAENVHARDAFQQTPLHVAAYEPSDAIVRILLEAGADSAVQDRSGWTPLHAAASGGRLATCLLLLRSGSGADGGVLNRDGTSALHYLARYCFDTSPSSSSTTAHATDRSAVAASTAQPLQRSATSPQLSEKHQHEDDHGRECTFSSSNTVEKPTKKQREREGKTKDKSKKKKKKKKKKKRKVAAALPREDETDRLLREVFAALIKHGACPNSQNRHGETPLHQAALRQNVRATCLLLHHEARVVCRRLCVGVCVCVCVWGGGGGGGA
jgi:ankyrin repeat protein